MMLRNAVRQTLVVPLTVAMVGLYVFNYLDRGQPWRGDLTWSLDWSGSIFLLTAPVLAAAAAVAGGRSGNPARALLNGAHLHPLRSLSFELGVIGGPLALMHLTFLLLYATSTTDRAHGALGAIVAAGCFQVVCMGFYLVLGFAVGRAVGAVLGPIAAIALVLALRTGGLMSGTTFDFLDAGSAVSPLVEFQMSGPWVLQSGLVVAALTAGAISAICLSRTLADRRFVSTGLLVVLALLMTLPRLIPAPERLHYTSERAEVTCQEAVVLVCVRRPHERLLQQTVDAMTTLIANARANGIQSSLPEVFTEGLPSDRAGSFHGGRFELPLDAYRTGEVPTSELAASVAQPWWCAELYAEVPPPTSFFDQIDMVSAALSAPVAPARRAELRAAVRSLDECGR